jgi:hypothetical protein
VKPHAAEVCRKKLGILEYAFSVFVLSSEKDQVFREEGGRSMKRALLVSLIVSLALLTYVGCKKKTEGINVPMGIYRVTFSDENENDVVDGGDILIVQFDRHIILNTGTVTNVFELSGAMDDFGTGCSMTQTSGHAITIVLGTGASLQESVDGYITSGIRIVDVPIPSTAIQDATWLKPMSGGGSYKSMGGRLMYAAPVLFSAIYVDEDLSGGLTIDDTITLTFSKDISVNTIGAYRPWRSFIVPVDWDYFGSNAYALQTASNEVTIYIGSGAKFTVAGIHTIGDYIVDHPSGIDMAIKMPAGLVTYDVGTSDETVPPYAIDIDIP